MAFVPYGEIPELDQAAAGRLRRALLEHGSLATDLSKREALAAMMLQALLSNPGVSAGPQSLVEDAACYADRLLEALNPTEASRA